MPNVSFASSSPGQPAGYTKGLSLCSGGGDRATWARQLCQTQEQGRGLRPTGLHLGQRPCPVLLPPLEMVSWQ